MLTCWPKDGSCTGNAELSTIFRSNQYSVSTQRDMLLAPSNERLLVYNIPNCGESLPTFRQSAADVSKGAKTFTSGSAARDEFQHNLATGGAMSANPKLETWTPSAKVAKMQT